LSRETGRRFHFMREIASGGFGAVYLTKVMHADGFSRLAAVKLLHRRWSENEEIARRMRDEARLLGWLRHRNIVDVVDLTSIDGRAAVVMEYLEAVDLKFIVGQMTMRGERVPARAVLEAMSSVASALDAAYNRPPYPGERPLHVIHRDIKPSNIMIDETGLVKVLDFGVARADFDARESHTKELQFGSVDYMPPERLFFEPETPASDVYSLGATMYEVMTQEKLGKAKGRPERHARFLADRFSYMRAAIGLGGSEATEVERLLTQCLSFEHGNRPAASEVVKLARQVARALPGPSLIEWAEDSIRELITLQEQLPRSPTPLTDSILSEDSKAFGVSQGDVSVSMDETLREDAPSSEVRVEIEDDEDDDSDVQSIGEPVGEPVGEPEPEPVPEKPPWMFEETREDTPAEAHALREQVAAEVFSEDEPASPVEAPFGSGDPFLDEPPDEPFGGAFGTPANAFGESEPPDTEEPAPRLRSNPTIIPELADLPPLPAAAANPFVDEVDPDLMATRVGPLPEPDKDDATLLRPPESTDFEEAATRQMEPVPQAPTPVAPVVDSIPGFQPSLDDWDDIPTRIEAEPKKEEKSGAAKVSGSVVSVVSEAPLPDALPRSTPPPEMSDGDDSTQLMPDGMDPGATMPPPPVAAPPVTTPPPVVASTPPPVSSPPPVAQAGNPVPPAEPKKSKAPMLAGGCFAFVLFIGCCGGLGWGWTSGLVPGLIAGGPEIADVDDIDVPEVPDEVVVEAPDEPDTPDEPVEEPPVEAAVTPTVTPDAPAPAAGGIQFISVAPGTKKLKVSCSGGKADAKGDTVVYENGDDPKCSVTAYMDDRSRLTAIVIDASEGTYRCFEGGDKRCEK
jgi:serine/threonine protein kinase